MIENGPHAGDGRANPYKSSLVAGFTLSDEELADLVNFLKSLSDEQFITDPRFSDPFGAAQLAGRRSKESKQSIASDDGAQTD